jgi:hypothetical protein
MGCHSWFGSSASTEPIMNELQTGTQLASRKVEKRPSLSVVEREGEPAGAVSIALTVPGGCFATAAMGALLSSRLEAASLLPSISAYPEGLSVTLLLPETKTAASIMAQLDGALRTPVSAHEMSAPDSFALAPLLVTELSGFEGLWAPGEGCASTEDRTHVGSQTPTERFRAIAESTRKLSVIRERAHFGLVGPRSIVSAATQALVELPAWPSGESPTAKTFAGNQLIRQLSSSTTRRITLQFTTTSFARALAAAEALRHATAPLAGQLRTQAGHYRIENATAVPLAVGGILRTELVGTAGSEVSTLAELQRLLLVVLDEFRRQLALAPEREFSARYVLSQPDPRDAARLAAWVSLSHDNPSPRDHVVVTVSTTPRDDSPNELERMLDKIGAASSTAPIEQVVRVEPGQGGLLALLGSPCGTLDETEANAGASAVLLNSLAQRYSGTDGVELEAWTAPEGVGLLGHARVRPTDRTDLDLARRVGNVLGMVMATGTVSAGDALLSRDALIDQLNPGPRPALWLALNALSPNHPGTLIPSGTFGSLALLQTSHIEQRRRELLRRPLRLAVLANTRAEQAATLVAATSRWLLIHQDPNPTCPHVVPERAEDSIIRLAGTRADPSDAAVTIAIELKPVGSQDDTVARLLSWLLTREGGWLDRALTNASLATHTEGALVGGRARRGLMVLVGCTPTNAESVIAQTRGLLRHLASSYRIDSSEYRLAKEWFERTRTERRLLPRHRLVETWLNQPSAPPSPTLPELQSYLQNALSASAVTAVVRQPDL